MCFYACFAVSLKQQTTAAIYNTKQQNSVKLVKSLIMKFCVYLLSAKGRNTALLRTSNQACMHHHYYSICMYVCKVKHVSVVTDAQHLCCCCVKPLALVYVCINTTSHTPIVCECCALQQCLTASRLRAAHPRTQAAVRSPPSHQPLALARAKSLKTHTEPRGRT
jgi:hypothetical protein